MTQSTTIKKWFGRLAFEMLLVFITISMALFANGWWQEREHRIRSREILQACREEITLNQERVRAAMAGQKELLRRLSSFLDSSDAPSPRSIFELRDRVSGGRGLTLPMVTDTTWEMVIRTQAAQQIPVSLIRILSAVHYAQSRMLGIADHFQDIVLDRSNLDLARARETVSRGIVFLQILMEAETNLLARYEEALKAL